MAEVSIRGLRKSYGAQEVIHGVSVEITDGEFVVIVGPSGCGKSTLLRMVAGLEVVSAGEIAIGGRVVNRLEPKDRDVAMVFQNYALYPHMSVFANMAYSLRMRGMPKAEIEARVERVAESLQLTALLARRPRELSGGQRQRVAMGRAIVREPKVFLFDEPLSNLDAQLRVQLRAELQALHRRLRTTSLYVTHDQVEAMTLAQRMLVLNAGCTEQIGAPLEVYARPASVFVASFIGSPPMNLIRGRVDGREFVATDGTRVAVPAAPATLHGRDTLLGLRAEHLEPCSPGEALLEAHVDLVEPLGADTLAYGHLGTTRIAARLPGSTQAQDGTLALRFAPSAMHFFDPAGGQRIQP